MSEPQAYLNGQVVPASQAVLPVTDAGFVQGTTVAEQLRTFGGMLFQLDAHLKRLFRSLEIVGVDPGLSLEKFAWIAQQLAAANHALLAPGNDLNLTVFVTPGVYPAMAENESSGPTVCIHTFPLHFKFWSHKYAGGESLSTTSIQQVPSDCWPAALKCRSRMHYYLADRQAQALHPGSRALMLDERGFATETTTSNIVVYHQTTGLATPPRSKILPGISLAVLRDLGESMGIASSEHDLSLAEIASADEVFLTSTSPCVLPVVGLNGQPLGGGVPGAIYQRLLAAWSELVGLDIARQAVTFATR